MDLTLTLEKKHAYILMVLLVGVGSLLVVRAFGGTTPSVFGHSALELLVNSSSIVDESILNVDIGNRTINGSKLSNDSISATEINSTSLAGECATITGSAALCDGGDATGSGFTSISSYNTQCGPGTSCTLTCSSGTAISTSCQCCAGGSCTIQREYLESGTAYCDCSASGTINMRVYCIS